MKRVLNTLASRAMVLLIVAMLAFAGCTSTDSPTEPGAVTATAQPAPTSAPTENQAMSTTEPVPTVGPAQNQTSPTEVATPAESSAAPVQAKINLNDMVADDLLNTIPGFGSRMVREFFEYAPYVSIQQFRREIGKYVDTAQVTEYEQYVYVPVAYDESDEETLMQIPDVDETLAAQLMADRPYGSRAAFLAKLAESLSPADLVVAETYLVAQ